MSRILVFIVSLSFGLCGVEIKYITSESSCQLHPMPLVTGDVGGALLEFVFGCVYKGHYIA